MRSSRRSHTELRHAKRRVAKRRAQGGAVMFIVAMTLALLVAMGAYALTVASREVSISGYLRQNLQTHYLSEWAVLGAAEELSLNTIYQYGCTKNPAQCPPFPTPAPPTIVCPSLVGVPIVGAGSPPATIPSNGCRFLSQTQLTSMPTASQWTPLATSTPNTPATAGDLGNISVAPSFNVEFTDPYTVSVGSGFGTANGSVHGGSPTCLGVLTVTSFGLTPPTTGVNAYYQTASEGLEVSRAKITAGVVTDCDQ